LSQPSNIPDDRRAPPPNSSGIAADRDHRLSTKAILVALMAMILAIAVVIGLLQVFVVQRIPELSEARLQAAQTLWEAQGPGSYNMDLEIRGAQPGTVHMEVRDGNVVAMTRDGRSPPERTWDVWSVPGQFDTLQRELEMAEDPQHEMEVAAGTKLRLLCEFDGQLGFPRRYHRYSTGVAPEVFWRVTAFEPQ
jgi:hypothetical protein